MSYIKAIPSVLSKTANYTVSTNDGDNTHVNVDATAGAVTVTLYAASGNSGKIVSVKKTDASTNVVTVDGNASETLDGITSLLLVNRYDSVTLVCDGTNWHELVFPVNDGLSQSFRGLTLRTSPNADVAATTVTLDHADEITMQDGTRVADWDDLTADITASGANGLDTGSEGASRWYSIHAIRKSSDGTKGLLLHRAKSYDLNQSQTTGGTGYYLRHDTDNQKVSQGFTPSVTGSLPFVDWYLKKVGSPTGQFYFTIEADSGGTPSGTPLATSDKLDASQLATSYQWVRAVFRSPVSLTSGTLYHMVLYGTFTISTTNYIDTAMSNSGLYAGGTTYAYNGSAWIALGAAWDYVFRTYVTQNDAALTMPSGYDQYAQVGWVYNNSSSNFNPFTAADRRVRTLAPVVLVGSFTSNVPTLTDLSAFVPPVPVLVGNIGAHSAGASYGQLAATFVSSIANPGYGGANYIRIGEAAVYYPGEDVFSEFAAVYVNTGAATFYSYVTGFGW